MAYLKQTDIPKKGKKTKSTPPPPQAPVQSISVDASVPDLVGIEMALSELAHSVHSYVSNAAQGENMLKLYTGPEGSGYHPVLIALDPCGEATEDLLAIFGRIATAFESIANALTHQQAKPIV